MEVKSTEKNSRRQPPTARNRATGRFVYTPEQRKRLAKVAVRANEASGPLARKLPRDLIDYSKK